MLFLAYSLDFNYRPHWEKALFLLHVVVVDSHTNAISQLELGNERGHSLILPWDIVEYIHHSDVIHLHFLITVLIVSLVMLIAQHSKVSQCVGVPAAVGAKSSHMTAGVVLSTRILGDHSIAGQKIRFFRQGSRACTQPGKHGDKYYSGVHCIHELVFLRCSRQQNPPAPAPWCGNNRYAGNSASLLRYAASAGTSHAETPLARRKIYATARSSSSSEYVQVL